MAEMRSFISLTLSRSCATRLFGRRQISTIAERQRSFVWWQESHRGAGGRVIGEKSGLRTCLSNIAREHARECTQTGTHDRNPSRFALLKTTGESIHADTITYPNATNAHRDARVPAVGVFLLPEDPLHK